MQPQSISSASPSGTPPVSPRSSESSDSPSSIDRATQKVAERTIGKKALPEHNRTDARPSAGKKVRATLPANLPTEQEIAEAFEQGPQEQEQFLEKCIDEGRDLNAIFPNGRYKGVNLLWIAQNWRRWDVFDRMLKQLGSKANVNATPAEGPDRGKTVLWYSVCEEAYDEVRYILCNCLNPDVNAGPAEGYDKGETVLLKVAKSGFWNYVDLMLEKCPYADVSASAHDSPGMSALWLAADSAEWELVTKMLEFPTTDVNKPIDDPDRAASGSTVLWWTAHYAKWDVVKLMIDKFPGADINAAPYEGDHAGESVLWNAADDEEWDCVRQMLELRGSPANLDAGGEMTVRQMLLESGCSDLRILALLYPRAAGQLGDDDARLAQSIHSAAHKTIACFFGSVAREEDAFFGRFDNHIKYKLCKEAFLSELKEPSLASYPQTDVWLMAQINSFLAGKFTTSLHVIARIGFRNWRQAQDMTRLPHFTKAQIRDIFAMLTETVAQFAKQHGLRLDRANRLVIANAISNAPALSKPAVKHALAVAFGKI